MTTLSLVPDEYSHSLFLSIANCSGLESTIAFGGEVWRVPAEASKLNWSTMCNCGGSLLLVGCCLNGEHLPW